MKVVLLRISPAVLVFAVAAARLADYQVAQVAAVVEPAVHAAPVASSPDLVLCEPAVVVDHQVAPVAVVVAHVAPQPVHRAAAVALVPPDVQLALHEPDAPRAAAADVVHCLRLAVVPRVVVAQPHEAVAVVPQVSVVPLLVGVPFFVLPAAEAQRCLAPDARLAPGTSVPLHDQAQDSRASSSLNPDGTAVLPA